MSQPLDSESDEPEDQAEADRIAESLALLGCGQELYWEWFDVIAQRNPYYGPWLPPVLEPVTPEEYGAPYFEANRLAKPAQHQSEVKQAHLPRKK